MQRRDPASIEGEVLRKRIPTESERRCFILDHVIKWSRFQNELFSIVGLRGYLMNFLPFFLFVALRRIVQKMTGIDSIYRDSLIGWSRIEKRQSDECLVAQDEGEIGVKRSHQTEQILPKAGNIRNGTWSCAIVQNERRSWLNAYRAWVQHVDIPDDREIHSQWFRAATGYCV